MKITTKNIPNSLIILGERLRQSYKLIFFVIAACIVGYLVLQINLLANSEPSPEALSAKLLEVRQPRVDEKTVRILKDLEDNNTNVQSIFQQARENPFAE